MKTNRLIALSLALLMLFGLSACGSAAKSANAASGYYSYSTSEMAAPAEAPAYVYEMAEEDWAYDEEGFAAAAPAQVDAPSQKPETDTIRVDKIIYSSDVTLEVSDLDKAIAQLTELIGQYGGFVESSSVSGNTYYNIARGNIGSRSASYTIRIPSESFSTVMNSFSTIGNVPYSSTYTQNITSQYYDTQARLTAYRTQEQTLLQMMEKAESVADLIAIEDKLTDVRYCIESLQSTLNNWDRKVNFSTIMLTVSEVKEYTPTKDPTFGEKLLKSAQDGLIGAVKLLSDLLLWLLEALPTLIILGLIVFGLVKAVIGIRRHSKKPKAAKKERRFLRSNSAEAPEAPAAEAPQQEE
ncbi:MAG: DUF4349 domain-containing protein [Oscillospiraceae bacterium]|nr:DUF4349 domain-containing protein [Oscillospiraceae bacterium]